MNNFSRLIYAIIINIPAISYAAEKPVFVIDIIRHGDRTPTFQIPSVDYVWQEGLGQLTAIGMQQEYQLGTAFRKKYIEHDHLLPMHYKHGTMYVRSTDYHRTLMSAASLLTGLYPPGTGPSPSKNGPPALPYAIQPIPIFSAPAQMDDVILEKIGAEKFEKLMERYVYSNEAWQKKDNELKANYPRWSKLTGIEITRLIDIDSLSDALYVHKLHHAPMPSGLTNEEIETIINAGQWAFTEELKPRAVASAFSSKLMKRIARYLNEGSQDNAQLKYILLSAHDTTITTVLSFLDAPLQTPPPYASHVTFSLYEQSAQLFAVKVTYNNNPVYIPDCGGYSCELKQFISLVEQVSQQSD